MTHHLATITRSSCRFFAAAVTAGRPRLSAVFPFAHALSAPAHSVYTRRCFSSSFTSSTSASPSSHGLTHVDASLRPTMVDVGGKSVTARAATAQCVVLLPDEVASVFDPVKKDWQGTKGPVLVTAIIAGTSAVKRTSDLIPFCHPLPLDSCKFHTEMIDNYPHAHGTRAIRIECTVKCHARTGIEMEALTGATVAGLTVYDMLKALSHHLVLTDVQLLTKTGGKSNFVNNRTTT